jgi:nucleotide-binding universal stress UspA family protein
MAVATGSATVSTNFFVPFDIHPGESELCVVANGIASPCVPLHVRPAHLDPHDRELWAELIGSLADGDLWVLGPNGPIPVDPWGPTVAREADAARAAALEGLAALRKLGSQVFEQRKRAALKVEVAPDEGSPEGEAMEEEARERLDQFARRRAKGS